MKILVIEDNDSKIAAITEFLNSNSVRNVLDVGFAKSLSRAAMMIGRTQYDLIVLDLMLPYLEHGTADSLAGLELLTQIRDTDSTNFATTVVGLSAFPDEIESVRFKFEDHGVLIIAYDGEGRWKRAFSRVLSEVSGRLAERVAVDFLIVVALEEERRGYGNTDLVITSKEIVAGLDVHFVSRSVEPAMRGAIIKARQMGLVAATLETTTALARFVTPIICMSGICAGFKAETSLGQLVLASPAWEYQAGKWSTNEFEIAPFQVPLPASTRAIVDQALSDDRFLEQLEVGLDRGWRRPPQQTRPILAPAATGSAVIADHARLAHIEKQHRKVACLDMETYGLYFAAHESNREPRHYFSIKCVVDLADSAKGDDLHPYGCAVSARAAVHLIDLLLKDEQANSRLGA